MRGTRTGILHGTFVIAAWTLLFLLLAGSAWALTATDCATCHGADVVEGHHDLTPGSYYEQGLCNKCHVGITTGNDCATCHQPTGLANTHHIPPTGQTTINCAQCHSGAGNPKDCSSCHKGEVPRTFHHTKLTAYRDATTGKLNCTTCHPGAQLINDCKSCHDEGSAVNQATHHAYVNPATNSKPVCTSCHTQLQATNGSCQNCHVPRAKMDKHHAVGKAGGQDCHACHTPILPGSFGAGCAQCHTTGSNRDFHHQTVMLKESKICIDCHSGATTIGGCNSCHMGQTSTIHHISEDYQTGTCNSCHTSSGLAVTGCRECHHFLPSDPLYRGNIHHSNSYRLGCYDCHTILGGVFQLPPDDCISCHEGSILNAVGIQQTHHLTTTATAGQCATCHAGSTSTTGHSCTDCHLANGNPPTVDTHHATAFYTSGECHKCHTGINAGLSCSASGCHTSPPDSTVLIRHHDQYAPISQLTCDSCHTGSEQIYSNCNTSGCHVPSNGSITARHHMTIPAQLQQCATCHKTVDGSSLKKDCSSCHIGSGKPPIVTQHHSTDAYLTGNCAGCHINTAPANTPCSGCHPKGTTITNDRHHNKTVLVGATVTSKPCKDCHSTIALDGTTCATCHTLPMAEFHHDNGPDSPLTAAGGNCAVCHQSVSAPSVCANCHQSTPHHTTTWSLTGDCTHCHAVPAWAADRPAQAACRECHGATMHAKGGPIQNFGTCAACHNTAPYHAAPTAPPGYLGYGAGKGKFNIFLAQNAGEHGDSNDIRPNGEDLRDEGGKKYLATQLTFSTKRISYNGDGKYYTVPYFTSMPTGNLALTKTATASAAESGYSATLAVDGDVATRWWKKVTSTTSVQWVKVDLGATKRVAKVALRWHSYYAKKYDIQVSTDNSTWTTVFSNSYGAGGSETRTFTSRDARYIRVYCREAASTNGFALYEFEAYAP